MLSVAMWATNTGESHENGDAAAAVAIVFTLDQHPPHRAGSSARLAPPAAKLARGELQTISYIPKSLPFNTAWWHGKLRVMKSGMATTGRYPDSADIEQKLLLAEVEVLMRSTRLADYFLHFRSLSYWIACWIEGEGQGFERR